MPQFHETPMGLKFFQVDLPRLLTVLERIADALEKQAGEKKDREVF
jgi:hypothetical protein